MNDTIAAISTPFGEGGIGIIRISGEDAFSIIEKVFRQPGKRRKMENRKLTYGNIIDPDTEKIIDEVLCVEMKAPGEKERPRQVYVQGLLRRLGFTVFSAVDSREKIDDVVRFCWEAMHGRV